MPPFNFELSAQIFSDGDPQVHRYENGRFRQVIRIGHKFTLISVESVGTVEKPRLSVELKTNRKPTESEKENAGKIAQNWGKWKGLAAYYLIVAEITGIKL